MTDNVIHVDFSLKPAIAMEDMYSLPVSHTNNVIQGNFDLVSETHQLVNDILNISLVKFKGDIGTLKMYADYLQELGVDMEDIESTINVIVNPIIKSLYDDEIQDFAAGYSF